MTADLLAQRTACTAELFARQAGAGHAAPDPIFIVGLIFIDEGEQRAGKLGLHLAEGQDGWKIVAVLFAYDKE
jgi:hypothetical protein